MTQLQHRKETDVVAYEKKCELILQHNVNVRAICSNDDPCKCA